MPEVQPPVVPYGPQNLVNEWEVQHYVRLPGVEPDPQFGLGRDVFVLRLWTERHQPQPIQFCLSPPAVAQMARGLSQALEEYLCPNQETE